LKVVCGSSGSRELDSRLKTAAIIIAAHEREASEGGPGIDGEHGIVVTTEGVGAQWRICGRREGVPNGVRDAAARRRLACLVRGSDRALAVSERNRANG